MEKNHQERKEAQRVELGMVEAGIDRACGFNRGNLSRGCGERGQYLIVKEPPLALRRLPVGAPMPQGQPSANENLRFCIPSATRNKQPRSGELR